MKIKLNDYLTQFYKLIMKYYEKENIIYPTISIC